MGDVQRASMTDDQRRVIGAVLAPGAPAGEQLEVARNLFRSAVAHQATASLANLGGTQIHLLPGMTNRTVEAAYKAGIVSVEALAALDVTEFATKTGVPESTAAVLVGEAKKASAASAPISAVGPVTGEIAKKLSETTPSVAALANPANRDNVIREAPSRDFAEALIEGVGRALEMRRGRGGF
jgi:hypothetical protein